MDTLRRRMRRVPLAAAILAALAVSSTASAAAPDPRSGYFWGRDYGGTYRFDGSVSLAWMRAAVSRAAVTIGHATRSMGDGHIADLRNPDFTLTTSPTADGTIKYISSATNRCDTVLYWKGCADAYSDQPFRLWLASNYCWTDGTNDTCSGTRYDVETIALNEFGHINTLGHHANPTYSDAVVQAVPRAIGQSLDIRRKLAWADTDGLFGLYGWRDANGCYPAPCVYSPVP